MGGDEEKQKITGVLLFGVFVAVTGNSFLFGYNIGVVNTPSAIIQEFYNKTYFERDGGDWDHLQSYISYLANASQENNSTDHTVVETNQTISAEEFGIDTSLLLEKWQLEILWSVTVALFVFFGMVGAFSSGKVADFFGRKRGMIVITFIQFLAGLLGGITVVAKSPECLMLSRVLVGLHSGMGVTLCPMYLAEVAPRRIRGSIGACHQLGITIGILSSQILGLEELLGTKTLWPLLFAFNAVPSIICVTMMPFCPESPRFLLINRKREEEARKSLTRLRGTTNVHEEMEEMAQEARKNVGATNLTFKQLVTSPDLKLTIIIACVLQVSQQWSGVNAVFSYSAFIFAQAKISAHSIPYVIVGTGVINVLATIVALPLMEKAGRRLLLLWPMSGMALFSIFMTIFLNLMGKGELADHHTIFAIVCIVSMHLYVIGFALGLGPIPFIVVSEIFRQEARAPAMSLALAVNWVCNFVLMLIFPFLKDALEEYTYIVFALILAGCFTFIFFLVPETKNKTFDEIANAISLGRAKGTKQSYAIDEELQPIGKSKM